MNRKHSRRQFVRLLATGIGLSAASRLETSVSQSSRTAKAAVGFDWKRFKGTQIHFVMDSQAWTEVMTKKIPEFQALTEIKVNWEVLTEAQIRQKLPLTLRSNPESVDGFWTLPSFDVVPFSKAGWYEPLDKYIQSKDLTHPDFDFKDFFPNVLKIAQWGGVQIGIPAWTELQLLFYNKEEFEKKKVSVPRTLDQFVEAAKTLNDRRRNLAGYLSRGQARQAVYTLAPFVFAYGGRWQNEAGRPELDSEPFIKGLTVYGSTLRHYGPPNIVGMEFSTAEALFAQGQAAMFTDGAGFLFTFEDPKKSKVVGKVGVAPLPAGPTGTRSTMLSWSLAINSKSRKKEATWYLIQYLVSKENQRLTAAAFVPPTRQSVWRSP
ncbi:MAG TPA: sugar ABC transporter substrate-binding protein, partial [Candidatus Dormibacteraeota bacterium]|nr:sugar ABC transporter substrate-binding protein [Candidatus Dormibacteraeota bacterium]